MTNTKANPVTPQAIEDINSIHYAIASIDIDNREYEDQYLVLVLDLYQASSRLKLAVEQQGVI